MASARQKDSVAQRVDKFGSDAPPDQAAGELARVVTRTLALQGGLMLVTAALLLGFGILQGAWGAAFGGGLGMVATVLSKRSVNRSAVAALKAPQMALVPVYMGLLNKLVIVGGGLAVGLIALRLPPLYVVAGYIVSQLALVVVAITSRNS